MPLTLILSQAMILELIQYLAVLTLAGLLAGFVAGLLGVGGGLVTVPVTYTVFQMLGTQASVALFCAIATSLATIVPLSIRSGFAHYRNGNVDMALTKQWIGWICFGALVGGGISFVVQADMLRGIFSVVVLFFALNFLRKRQIILGPQLPQRAPWKQLPPTGIGVVCALMGIGGGLIAVPYFKLFSVPTHRAVGTASAFGVGIAAPGVLGYLASGWDVAGRPVFSLGYVHLPALAVLVPMSLFLAPKAARLSHRLSARTLEIIFAIYLFVVFGRMALFS